MKIFFMWLFWIFTFVIFSYALGESSNGDSSLLYSLINIYLIGCMLAFVIELITTIYMVNLYFSIRAQNFKKIGLYYNISTGELKKRKPNSVEVIIGVAINFLFSVLGNWWSVISKISTGLGKLYQKLSLPDNLKEFHYTFNNVLLYPKDIFKIIKGTAIGKIWDIQPLVLWDDTSISASHAVSVISDDKIFIDTTEFINSGYYKNRSIYKYKIEGNQVFQKLWSYDSNNEYQVKDGIIIEEELSKNAIIEFKKALKWNEITFYKTKLFILSKHQELIEQNELRDICIEEVQIIKNFIIQVKKVLKESGFELIYSEERQESFTKPIENYQGEPDYEKSERDVEKLLKKYGVTSAELASHEEKIIFLEKYINNWTFYDLEEYKEENEKNPSEQTTNNQYEKRIDSKKLLETIFTVFPAIFLGIYGTFLFGLLGMVQLLVLFGAPYLIGNVVGGKGKNNIFDSIIKWSNLISWIIPPVGLFSASYTLQRYEKISMKKYYYLGMISLVLSLLNGILGMYLEVSDLSVIITSEESIKYMAMGGIFGIIGTYKAYHERNK